jgi:putative oxidoreductase
MKSISANLDRAPALIGRILIAVIFIFSGLGKVATPDATIGYVTAVGVPAPLLGYIAATVLELAGGVLLVVGYQTRVIALLLAAYSIITALIFHHAFGDQNQMFHFLKNVAMAGGLIQVVAFGAGAYSFDNRRLTSGTRAA